ncbi:double-strand break repair helicase AddA [Sphingomonas sp.]|uniref:double-strand break repair helicase AddA n=1 Tax=Sphingomonas sp. TaxID=28214 RepID=UPI001821D2C3|nr:double-strand break repair helicase AddA [Sphingomonas sp.]MBA3511630.1 double-strand break repair helicase AddA [Sphingomonas sp.]
MRRQLKPFPELQGDQALAADPGVHAALSASAGTGKTQVLSARVLRLLLSGVRPEHILCLTFTKAGAAEMANRINVRLASWVRMRDQDLRTDLINLGEVNDPLTMQRARRLFAKILDAPGGLRIQTIHGFAQALLAAFPAEAGITPGFQPIEGRAEQELARTTLANLLADAEGAGDEALIADVQCLSLRLGEKDAIAYLMQCARASEALAQLGPPETIEGKLRTAMQLPEGALDDYLALHCADDRFDCDLLQAIAAANRKWGSATGTGVADSVERWLALDPAARAAALPDLALLVFTGTGDLRKVQAGQRNADPAYDTHAERLAAAVSELLRIQNGARLACDMAAGLRAGQAFAAAYSRAKRSAGVADFDDLIRWTRRLLETPGMGEWVRYKLDRRTDHILVDESQDTNRDQWEIIKPLAAEYFSGSSEAEGRIRTIFMVGDFKQAIFGFQGTDPNEFQRAREWVEENSSALRRAEDEADDSQRLALEFRDLSIDASFRSAPAVLEVVDAVIDEVGFRDMGLPEPPNRHRAFFDRRPGLVELWKPFSVETDDESEEGEESWLDERDRKYATALADQIKRWLDSAPILASTKRPLGPGDILVLVRSRGELASLIVARLFAAKVPVAGIDRLHLSKPFAVRDLLAAVAFAVQPLDDLNLANLLVSPLIGWSQDQLFDLAYGREKAPLWRVLRDRSGEQPHLTQAHEALGALLAMADFTTPARFLETILSGPLEGRRKLYRRLGLASRDPIDELLSSAMEFERSETPSLDRFLAWFGRGDVEIQRDPSAPAQAVRVMTVHGAKGLEAPFVILADATADPTKLGGTARSFNFPLDAEQTVKVPLIRPRKAERISPFAEVMAKKEQSDLQEHMRLLYVGLTRAIERLVVAGVEPRGERAENCWHTRVERALISRGAQPEPDDHWGETIQYRGSVAAVAPRPKPPRIEIEPPPVPDWARSPAPPESRPPRPLAPSALVDDKEAAPAPSAEQRAAARRGTLIHQLFERLPGVEAEQRPSAAMRWLERSAGLTDAAERQALADLVCAILEDPRFSPLFGRESLAEAPIAATLADGRVVAGTVDRLRVEDDRVSVIDFKTGRVPESEEQIPAPHRAQMSAYAEALAVIFPGRAIRSALLYTAEPRLFELGG